MQERSWEEGTGLLVMATGCWIGSAARSACPRSISLGVARPHHHLRRWWCISSMAQVHKAIQ